MMRTLIASVMLSIGCAYANQPVTFTLTASQAAFLDGGQVTVQVYNAEQIRRMETQRNCRVSWDRVKETMHCPDGQVPEEVVPEVFTFSQADLAAPLLIVSQTVTTGEAYQLWISGTAEDDCNTTSGGMDGKARQATIDLDIHDLMTTRMACVR